MTTISGKPTTQLVNLNVTDTLFINGVPVVALGGEVLIDAVSTATDQQPSAVDTPLQIEFGAAQGTAEDAVQLLANGDIVINKTGIYNFDFFFQIGRTGAAGVSFIFGRLTIDNVQPTQGQSVFTKLDDADFVIPTELETTLPLSAGQVVRIELIRDSAGNNSGGLFAGNPTPAGWNNAPSATVQIREVVGVTL